MKQAILLLLGFAMVGCSNEVAIYPAKKIFNKAEEICSTNGGVEKLKLWSGPMTSNLEADIVWVFCKNGVMYHYLPKEGNTPGK